MSGVLCVKISDLDVDALDLAGLSDELVQRHVHLLQIDCLPPIRIRPTRFSGRWIPADDAACASVAAAMAEGKSFVLATIVD